MMYHFNNFTQPALLYTLLHSTYCVCWLTKHMTFRDKNFDEKARKELVVSTHAPHAPLSIDARLQRARTSSTSHPPFPPNAGQPRLLLHHLLLCGPLLAWALPPHEEPPRPIRRGLGAHCLHDPLGVRSACVHTACVCKLKNKMETEGPTFGRSRVKYNPSAHPNNPTKPHHAHRYGLMLHFASDSQKFHTLVYRGRGAYAYVVAVPQQQSPNPTHL